MSWTAWSKVVSPITGGDVSLDALIDTGKVTYNYELPFKNYINFSFDLSKAAATAVKTVGDAGASAFNDLQKQCVRNALNYVSSMTGLSFNELAGGSTQNTDLVFVLGPNVGTDASNNALRSNDYTEYTVTADAFGNIATLDVRDTIVLSSLYEPVQNTQAGYEGYTALLREIGHALGLKYPSTGDLRLPSEMDNPGQTVMSINYNAGPNRTDYTFTDRKALNWLYGGDGLLGTYGLTVDAGGNPVAAGGPAISAASALTIAGVLSASS